MRALFLAPLVLLVGCQTAAEYQAQVDATDQARCIQRGAPLGTPLHLACRIALDEDRRFQQLSSQIAANNLAYEVNRFSRLW